MTGLIGQPPQLTGNVFKITKGLFNFGNHCHSVLDWGSQLTGNVFKITKGLFNFGNHCHSVLDTESLLLPDLTTP